MQKIINKEAQVVDPEGFILVPDLSYNLASLVPGLKVGHDNF
jgi:hypothetical protein